MITIALISALLVLYHHGLSASGGHYNLDVLHPERFLGAGLSMTGHEGWVRIGDKIVSDVRPEDVFGAVGRDDRCAYLLFYAQMVQ
jgi:ubiquitin carboxyl-terminal hydrolase 10